MRAARALARWLVDLARPGTPSQPRICSACGWTTERLTPSQCAQIGSKIQPTCGRRRCDGVLEGPR